MKVDPIFATAIPNLKTLDLSTDCVGVREYFLMICDKLCENFMSQILVCELESNVGGVFEKPYQINVIRLPAPEVEYDSNKHMLTLTDEGLQSFIHESSHFLHQYNKGVCIAPAIKGKVILMNTATQADMYNAEYEAGFRATFCSKLYGMNCQEQVLSTNLKNLYCYKKHVEDWFRMCSRLLLTNMKTEVMQFMDRVFRRYCQGRDFEEFYNIDAVNIDLTTSEQSELQSICDKVE